MNIDVVYIYGTFLLLLALVYEIYIHHSHKNENVDSKIKEKNKFFAPIPLYSLGLMGFLVLLIGYIVNIANFRVAWIINEANGKHEMIFNTANTSNELFFLLDIIFIFFIFCVMIKYYQSVNYRAYTGYEEGFIFDAKRESDLLFFLPIMHPFIYVIYCLGFSFIGISFFLIVLSCIPVIMLSYVFHFYNKKKKT